MTMSILLTSCLKTREVIIPTEAPPVVTGDTISKGAIFINEVNNRWSETLNLSNELSSVIARRYDPIIGTDWKDGKVKWFELYNNTNKAITLGDPQQGYWYLSDNMAAKNASPIEVRVTIPAGGFAIVYSSDTSYRAGTEIHSNFNVGRNNSQPRDTLGIYYQKNLAARLMTVDSLTYEDTDRATTWSRIPDGGSVILKTPGTPGQTNRR